MEDNEPQNGGLITWRLPFVAILMSSIMMLINKYVLNEFIQAILVVSIIIITFFILFYKRWT
jgi:hypothetical protein